MRTESFYFSGIFRRTMTLDQIFLIASDTVQSYIRQFGYLGIYFWFITVDQLTPLPEEITLLAIGYLAYEGYLNPFGAGVFSLAAFLTIDIIYFYLTRSGNKLVQKIRKKEQNARVQKFTGKLKDHTLKTLIILCFIPRMRLLGPVFVALQKIPFKKFILYDAIGLSIFTAIYISLGMLFHKSISSFVKETEIMGHIIFIAALIFMTIASIIVIRRFK
jgi:membrane protein DedA with SNARE-associated domain